jgi:2-phospho-L-lactate guanylyltransferase
MLRTVLHAANGLRVAIVSPATAGDVRRFALINGARFLPEPDGGGLNGAVNSGFRQLGELGYERVAVVHSDLPNAVDITWLASTEEDAIIIVPDRTGKGTNAISVPSGVDFTFSYGPGSFDRHVAEARRLGVEPRVVLDPDGLSFDVDEPADLPQVKTKIS